MVSAPSRAAGRSSAVATPIPTPAIAKTSSGQRTARHRSRSERTGSPSDTSPYEAGAQVPNNDCWIAACCVVHNLPLLTHDQDFKPLAAQGLTLL